MVSVQDRVRRRELDVARGAHRWFVGFMVALIITLGAAALSIFWTRDLASPYTPEPHDATVPRPSD